MPKRTVWMVTGIVVGAGSSLWAERRVRRTFHQAAARMQPDALAAEVGRAAQHAAVTAGERLRSALDAGRDEMHRHEEALWAELAERGAHTRLDSARLDSARLANSVFHLDN